jgi:hypothetical protein
LGSTASIDREATAAFYRSTARSSIDSCTCNNCAVYRANVDVAFTGEQRAALDKLGIDPTKDGELGWFHKQGENEHAALVHYAAIGELLEHYVEAAATPWNFATTAGGAHLGSEFVGVDMVIAFKPRHGQLVEPPSSLP